MHCEVVYVNTFQCKWSLLFLILYAPINNFSLFSGRVSLVWASTKQRIKCLAQGHNAVPPVRLKPTTPPSLVKHSTTEPSPSSMQGKWGHYIVKWGTVNVVKFRRLVAWQKVQTHSLETVWSESSRFAILTNILWIPALITNSLV